MSDYQAQLHEATRRLDEFSMLCAVVQHEENPAPLWFATDEGQRYIAALERVDVDEAAAICGQAYGRALDEWTTLLWLAPWPSTQEDARSAPRPEGRGL